MRWRDSEVMRAYVRFNLGVGECVCHKRRRWIVQRVSSAYYFEEVCCCLFKPKKDLKNVTPIPIPEALLVVAMDRP